MDCGFQVLDSGFPVSRTFIPDFDCKLLDSGIRISLHRAKQKSYFGRRRYLYAKQDVNYSDYEKEVVTSQASFREKNKLSQLCNTEKVLNEVMMSRK